jgi:hypothetical protein
MGWGYSIVFQVSGQTTLLILQERVEFNSITSREHSQAGAEESDDFGFSLHLFAHRHYI